MISYVLQSNILPIPLKKLKKTIVFTRFSQLYVFIGVFFP